MKDTKAVYVTTYELHGNLNSENDFSDRIAKIENDSSEASNERTKEFGCQYDLNNICTCKRIKRKEIRYYSSRQVYRSQKYLSTRGFTDIGVGDVKTLPRKRVKRIYLPYTVDAGVGSTEFIAIPGTTQNYYNSYYDQKKTSSKCVGGTMDCTDIMVVNEKLSPIIQTKSGSNSPKIKSLEKINNASTLANETTYDKAEKLQILSDKLEKNEQDTITTSIQEAFKVIVNINKTKDTLEQSVDEGKLKPVTACSDQKDFSSDSLVQHVHNLENPSDYKQSKISIDFIENKLEREYRKIFSTKPKERKPADEKITSDFKSTSTLRKRFEALRRGMNKKDEPKTDSDTLKISSRVSVPSKKDVSIVSDPPSLEARSYSRTKIFSPLQSLAGPSKKSRPIPQAQTSPKKSFTAKKSVSPNWSTNIVDSEGVKGMFKLWGKKFNLEDDNHGKVTPENIKNPKEKKVEIVKEEVIVNEKKQGKRFSFFRRKTKEKSKQVYKPRKGVTAGRCEVDGLMIKIGAANEYPPEPPITSSHRAPVEFEGILRKSWLQRYLDSNVDSKHSAQIRWHNNMYTTSSSTVFELIDCVYKTTGIIFKSKSEMTTAESSYYQSFTNPQINFMQQSIQAWMVPTILRDNQIITMNKNKKEKKNIEVTYSNQKWFIEKSKAFGHNIEVVLHSKNCVKHGKGDSSEYIMIDIPEGYFSDTNSDEIASQTSDEQVFNIVEYETANSNSYLKKRKKDNKMNTGDYAINDIQVTVSVKDSKNKESNILETVIKRPPLHRDVVVQGSNVYVPKRCDVIGVGIITQRDIRDIKKPILKIQDELTDESEHILPPQKKCEFAESYLQDYYRNWTPLGMDLYSWCVSESQLRGSSDSLNSLNQGDGSKSCPNIFDDYQASTIVSSCNTSSCSHCVSLENENKSGEQKKGRTIFKFRKWSDTPAASDGKRILPKDSLEVFKRRKLYALSNKALWASMDCGSEPYCVPSIEDKGAQNCLNECPPPQCKPEKKPRKQCKKHVSMPSCDVMSDLIREQLTQKTADGILAFKSANCDGCKRSDISKHARVIPEPTYKSPYYPCQDSTKRKPTCSKKNSSNCSMSTPVCPVRPPSPPPCKVPSPPPCRVPSPPPCVSPPPCLIPPCLNSKRTSPVPACNHPKPIPPKVHSPPMEPTQRPCACSPKKQSPCNSPKCPVEIWPSSPPQVSRSQSCEPTPPCSPPRTPPPSCKIPPKKTSTSCQASPPIMKYRKCPSKEFPWPIKNQSEECRLGAKSSESCTVINTKPKRPCTQPPPCRSRPKTAGLHLKKLPIPKCPSKDCYEDSGVIRLSSQEKITVRLKRPTDSTEEIREGCNIKVRDEDGQTMYERKNYHRDSRTHFVKDLYRDSRIHRVATENNDAAEQNLLEENICNSVPNVIEINLNLKFKQGDKAKGQYENYSEAPKDLEEISDKQQNDAKDVFVIQDQPKPINIKSGKKDLDIKIIIKNYKPNSKKTKDINNHCANMDAEDFSKNISEKFQTVSTGYSDVIEQNAFSVHRTTINLTDSNEEQNNTCRGLADKHFTEDNPANEEEILSNVILTKQSTTINTVRVKNEDEKIEETNDDKYETGSSTSGNGYAIVSDVKPKSTDSLPKIRNKEDKKDVLKQIFENADNIKKTPNKSKMQNIKKMLRAVLTSDSSTHDDIAVNNELANELTYASLKPNYFKNSESMTNYYLYDSSTSVKKNSHSDVEEAVYPSSDNNSESSDDAPKTGACLCSQFAAKLNIQDKKCCCCRPDKIDQEIICDLIEENYYKNKPEHVDVQTQDSKYLNKEIISNVNNDIGVYYEDGLYKRGQRLKSENKQIFSPRPSSVKTYKNKRVNRATVLGISDDDKIIVLNSNTETFSTKSRKIKAADILQSQETKKAVLEIYAEKTISNERIVARLPKFVYNKESEICQYHEIYTESSSISKRDIVLMSFTH